MGQPPRDCGPLPDTDAASHGNEHIVDLFLEAEADVNLTTGLSLNPLQCAARAGHQHIVQRLLDAGAERNENPGVSFTTALNLAAEECHSATVDVLLKAGADHNVQNIQGKTALHVVSRKATNRWWVCF